MNKQISWRIVALVLINVLPLITGIIGYILLGNALHATVNDPTYGSGTDNEAAGLIGAITVGAILMFGLSILTSAGLLLGISAIIFDAFAMRSWSKLSSAERIWLVVATILNAGLAVIFFALLFLVTTNN
jgi:hypothetical protein